MLSDHALSRALERAGLSAPVRFEEVTRSTQESALRLAADGAPEWTLVAAAHQTEGRGRLGRTWKDEPGSALMFSLVLRPILDVQRAMLIPLLAGAMMAESASELGTLPVRCKWPNDLLAGGAKVGGVIADARTATRRFGRDRLEHVVLGVGVNLRSAPESVPGAAAIGDLPAGELLAAFLVRFRAGYGLLGSDPAPILQTYRELSATVGTRVRATTTRGDVVEGEAIDVDDTGALLLRTDDGVEAVRFGEVEHLE